jgi:hypothetical protein
MKQTGQYFEKSTYCPVFNALLDADLCKDTLFTCGHSIASI